MSFRSKLVLQRRIDHRLRNLLSVHIVSPASICALIAATFSNRRSGWSFPSATRPATSLISAVSPVSRAVTAFPTNGIAAFIPVPAAGFTVFSSLGLPWSNLIFIAYPPSSLALHPNLSPPQRDLHIPRYINRGESVIDRAITSRTTRASKLPCPASRSSSLIPDH